MYICYLLLFIRYTYMKDLYSYILESNGTTSNKERLEELRKWLSGKKYEKYVDTLNKMLEDPKAKTLLDEGFGNDLCDVKFTYKPKRITASELYPTQNEIDIDKTLGMPLKKPLNIDIEFGTNIVLANMPLVTFNGKYIIDGHHRWSEVAVVNPDGKMLCFDYSANITVEQMLKAVQGTIAQIMSQKGEELPLQHIPKSNNIYDMSENEIREYIKTHITQESEASLKRYIDIPVEDYLTNNILYLKKHRKPQDDAPERGYMPQTSHGGLDSSDKKTSFPDKMGSALYKLSRGTVDKKTIE